MNASAAVTPVPLSCSPHAHIPLPPCPGRLCPEEGQRSPWAPQAPPSASQFVTTKSCAPEPPAAGNWSCLGTAGRATGDPKHSQNEENSSHLRFLPSHLCPLLAKGAELEEGSGARPVSRGVCLLRGSCFGRRGTRHGAGVPRTHVLRSLRCEQKKKFLHCARSSNAAAQGSPPRSARQVGEVKSVTEPDQYEPGSRPFLLARKAAFTTENAVRVPLCVCAGRYGNATPLPLQLQLPGLGRGGPPAPGPATPPGGARPPRGGAGSGRAGRSALLPACFCRGCAAAGAACRQRAGGRCGAGRRGNTAPWWRSVATSPPGSPPTHTPTPTPRAAPHTPPPHHPPYEQKARGGLFCCPPWADEFRTEYLLLLLLVTPERRQADSGINGLWKQQPG